MNQEEFEEYWCKNAGYTKAQYNEERTTVICKNCDYEKCQGWAAVPKGFDMESSEFEFPTTYKGEKTDDR